MKRSWSSDLYYLDSNIFIYSAAYDSSKLSKARYSTLLLKLVAEGKVQAFTSTLTWDEVVWAVHRLFDADRATMQGRALLELPNINLIPVDASIISGAQSLKERYGLKPRDCIHASSALFVRKAGTIDFVSYDSDFDDINGLKRITPDSVTRGTQP